MATVLVPLIVVGIATGIVVLFILALFRSERPELRPNERILATALAYISINGRSGRSQYGRLFVTNQRLVWTPSRLPPRLEPQSIELGQVSGVAKARALHWLDEPVRVDTSNGQWLELHTTFGRYAAESPTRDLLPLLRDLATSARLISTS